MVYPDELRQGKEISLAPLSSVGWNTIDQIVMWDVNGFPTLLRARAASTERRSRLRAEAQETYEMVTWSGARQSTNLEVLSYLVSFKGETP